MKMSETLVDQIRHGYELGANTIVDIITAENTYRSVESAYYSAVGAYVVAAYTLKHAVSDLPDSMSSSTTLSEIGLFGNIAGPSAPAGKDK
jgi:outer membrane protein TolC